MKQKHEHERELGDAQRDGASAKAEAERLREVHAAAEAKHAELSSQLVRCADDGLRAAATIEAAKLRELELSSKIAERQLQLDDLTRLKSEADEHFSQLQQNLADAIASSEQLAAEKLELENSVRAYGATLNSQQSEQVNSYGPYSYGTTLNSQQSELINSIVMAQRSTHSRASR